MDNEFLKEFLELQKEYFDERFDALEKKIDDHIGNGKKTKMTIITSFIAPIFTGIICFFVGRIFK